MATVQTMSTVPAQARTVRVVTTWSPASGQMYTRPWRSSPLARAAFSTLPPIISESSEESLEDDDPPDSPRPFEHAQRALSSTSILSDTLAGSTSGYGSRNTSGSASALMLVEGQASTSSISLHASSSAHGTGPSSHGHGDSQNHLHRPARLTKSPGRRPSSAQERLSPKNVSETSTTALPRTRTVSHGHSRPASLPALPVAPSPTIPQAYSRASSSPTMSPESVTNASKQPPSTSRDPTSNWMSSSPFGPAVTPKFSRLAMASPAVVMPLSAREYRKRKAKVSPGKGKEKESPTSSNHVTFIDSAPSAPQSPNGVPLVMVSPPPESEDVHQPCSPPLSSGNDSPDRRIQPHPQADQPPLPHTSLSSTQSQQSQSQPQPSPSMVQRTRPRSRPNTPPRSSPLVTHPPISPKSSASTFFSFVSTSSSDDDTTSPPPDHPHGADDPSTTNAIPPARPRPRPRRRKSYPDRLSNGARLSLVEAMNRLSQESATLHHLSGLSQADGANRLSVASQASGHTLFYDVESGGDGQVGGDQDRDGSGSGGQQRTSVLTTQSLEDLSSTLARTGIEVIHPDNDGDVGAPLDDERKGKRNVRMVRISDTVEVSPPSGPRRRKLTKSRPTPTRGLSPGPAAGTGTILGTVKEAKVQTPTPTPTPPHERRGSFLPWKSKGSPSDSKGGAVDARSGANAGAGEKRGEEAHLSTPTKGLVQPNETITPTPVRHSPYPIVNSSTHLENVTKLGSNSPAKTPLPDSPASTLTSTPTPTPRKGRRYTFSFLPSPTFHRPKREKSNTIPAGADLSPGQPTNTKSKLKDSGVKGIESGTDSTSTSIRTITQGSQSTLTPTSLVPYDLTTLASSGRGMASFAVPVLRRLNAQAMATAGVPVQSLSNGGGDSTPSLITNGSTATSSSAPRTVALPSFVRLPSGEPFVPQPSGLKESFTDTSEEDDLEGVHGEEDKEQTPRMCGHRSSRLRLSPSPRPGTPNSTLTTATETSGSYISFSTVPASTTSSSSTSPSLMMGDKHDQVVLGRGGGGDGDICTCASCGQLVPRSMSPTYEPDQVEMHPMFTVPLVTVPASAVSVVGVYPRASTSTGMGSDTRHVSRRKSERHLSVPVPAAVGVGVVPAKNGPGPHYTHVHVHVNGGVPATARTTKRTTVPPSPLSSPSKVKKRRRPQTAPPGMGDAASRFIEDTKALRVSQGTIEGHVGVGVGVGVGGDSPTKHKVGSGESKIKTVLKGLLRWHG